MCRGRDVTPPSECRGRDVTPPSECRGRDVTPPSECRGRDVTPPSEWPITHLTVVSGHFSDNGSQFAIQKLVMF